MAVVVVEDSDDKPPVVVELGVIFRLFGSIPLKTTSRLPVLPLFSNIRSNVRSKLLTFR